MLFRSLRTGSPRATGKSVIKDADVDTLRKALELINTDDMEADELKKIQALMSKLG